MALRVGRGGWFGRHGGVAGSMKSSDDATALLPGVLSLALSARVLAALSPVLAVLVAKPVDARTGFGGGLIIVCGVTGAVLCRQKGFCFR